MADGGAPVASVTDCLGMKKAIGRLEAVISPPTTSPTRYTLHPMITIYCNMTLYCNSDTTPYNLKNGYLNFHFQNMRENHNQEIDPTGNHTQAPEREKARPFLIN